MGKLILAIIAVAFLQIAFVVFIISDSPASIIAVVPDPNPDGRSLDLASISEPKHVGAPSLPVAVAEPSQTEPQPARTVDLASDRQQSVIEKPQGIPIKRVRRPRRPDHARPAQTYASRGRHTTDSGKNFTDTVILYDRSGALTNDRAANIPRARKRSFVAKATPILKKPWELIKGIASKLN